MSSEVCSKPCNTRNAHVFVRIEADTLTLISVPAVVQFTNTCWGSLSCAVFIHPVTRKVGPLVHQADLQEQRVAEPNAEIRSLSIN